MRDKLKEMTKKEKARYIKRTILERLAIWYLRKRGFEVKKSLGGK